MQPAEKDARLKINRTKTKYMESKKNRTYRVNNILLHEQSCEEVSSFKYLGSVVS
jgi:threonine dehydratase